MLRTGQLLDVGLQDRVEHGVVGQGIAIELVGAQLGAGGFIADRPPHQLAVAWQPQLTPAGAGGGRIEPGAKLEHAGFVEVADHGQAAVHVAVEGAITDGQLAFVAGGEQQLALLVGHSHQQGAADARLQVFGAQTAGWARQHRCQGGVEAGHQRRDLSGAAAQAQAPS